MWTTTVPVVLAVAAFALGDAEPTNTNTKVYTNRDFGLVVTMPSGFRWCNGAGDSLDHGPTVLLDPRDVGDCNYQERRRTIEFFSFFNATDETNTLEGLRQFCIDTASGKPARPPRHLSIPGYVTASARVDRNDGWIDVVVVSQTVRIAAVGGGPDPVNHTVTLHTDPTHLKEDLAVFRSVLKSTRFSPPDGR